MNSVIPNEIRVSKDRRTLTIGFGDGESHKFPAEYLRVFSPSAEVQGHSPDQKQLIAGKSNVEIMQIAPIGNYAIRITFDDMHDTGIFSWSWFHEMAENKDIYWSEYLDEIDEKGLNR